METQIVYCDETGDDGLNTSSSEAFILTSIYMPSSSWQENYLRPGGSYGVYGSDL